jgi:hypothetical protein
MKFAKLTLTNGRVLYANPVYVACVTMAEGKAVSYMQHRSEVKDVTNVYMAESGDSFSVMESAEETIRILEESQ